MADSATKWADELRAPFAPEAVGKLPKINCSDCAQKKGGPAKDRHCPRHTVKKCPVCGNYLTEAHTDLDFVGHAATTDRLLKVDPEWTWRPMATEVDTGFPKFDQQGGLWILLTVHGVTRPGYGDGKTPKEVIGDAIRNAAMRFGVALDLWTKQELHATDESPEDPRQASARQPRAPKPESTGSAPPAGDEAKAEHERAHAAKATSDLKLPPRAKNIISEEQTGRLWTIARGLRLSDEAVKAIVVKITGQGSTKAIPRVKYDAVIAQIELEGGIPF